MFINSEMVDLSRTSGSTLRAVGDRNPVDVVALEKLAAAAGGRAGAGGHPGQVRHPRHHQPVLRLQNSLALFPSYTFYLCVACRVVGERGCVEYTKHFCQCL